MHFTILHAMLMPSSEGEPHDTQCCALPPLSHRLGHEGWQDQSVHLKHDPFADAFALALAERLHVPLITTDHHEFDAVERKGHFRFMWLR